MYNGNLSTKYNARGDFPRTYADARERWTAWRDSPRRRATECHLAGNTTLQEREGKWTHRPLYAIRYHATDVATFYPDGAVTLHSNGWQTVTTRDRWNRAGIRVGMSGGIASVDHGGRDYVYRDGMTLEPDGSVRYRDGTPGLDAEPIRKARRRALARDRRAELAGKSDRPIVFRWPNRSGGWAPYGNAPEAR